MKRVAICAPTGLLLLGGCASVISAVENAQGGPTPFDQTQTEEDRPYVANDTTN